jgi:transglutaminase-like putative cysteine protease
MKRILSLLACAALPVLLAAAPATPELAPDQPYQAMKSSPVTYEVDFAAVVTPPAHTRRLRVWLPLPPSDGAQEVSERKITTFPMKVKPRIGREKTYGNEFAYFDFEDPQGAQIIRHRFRIKVWELRWGLDPAKVAKVERWPDTFVAYLRSDKSVVVDDRFRKLAHEIVPARRGEASDLADVMAWVNDHMRYDHAAGSLTASSEHALKDRVGHCSDYHGLCASFGRALGYPTRVVYGIHAFAKSSPSHCKLETYLPPYGWVSFDVSETQNLIAALRKDAALDGAKKDALIRAATERLRHGFRDNTWYLQTRGTDYDLAPPAARRVPVVRTLYAEADGVALPEPDPANPHRREFAWMTAHEYRPDRAVTYPFKDWSHLLRHE